MKVFLGGTCEGIRWRKDLIPQLKIDYFDPVVDDWNDEAKKNEVAEKNICDIHLYAITPYIKGVYSIAEAVEDSNKIPARTIFWFGEVDAYRKFTSMQISSLNATGQIIVNNGANWAIGNLTHLAHYLNSFKILSPYSLTFRSKWFLNRVKKIKVIPPEYAEDPEEVGEEFMMHDNLDLNEEKMYHLTIYESDSPARANVNGHAATLTTGRYELFFQNGKPIFVNLDA